MKISLKLKYTKLNVKKYNIIFPKINNKLNEIIILKLSKLQIIFDLSQVNFNYKKRFE